MVSGCYGWGCGACCVNVCCYVGGFSGLGVVGVVGF